MMTALSGRYRLRLTMVADAPHLDGEYAAFGKITEGLDVAQKIVNVRTDAMDKPVEPVVIKTIVVE